MKKIVSTLLLVSSLVVSSAQAGIIYFNDQTQWEAAVSGIVIEDFEDATLNADLTITSSWSGFGISGGDLNDRVTPSGTDTVYTFSSDIFAFAGLWDLAGPGGEGTGLALELSNGEVLTQEILRSLAGGFWGFISTDAFSSVSVIGGTQEGAAETHDIAELYYANGIAAPKFGNAAAVPEPSSIAILALGLLAFAARKRLK